MTPYTTPRPEAWPVGWGCGSAYLQTDSEFWPIYRLAHEVEYNL